MTTVTTHPVHKSLHAPLVYWRRLGGGIERRFFLLAWVGGFVVYEGSYSAFLGLFVFAVLMGAGWLATVYDPKILPILIGDRSKRRYDPLKHDVFTVVRRP